MSIRFRIHVALVCAAVLLPLLAGAQGLPDDPAFDPQETRSAQTRKKPGLFSPRPRSDSPAGQLDYAIRAGVRGRERDAMRAYQALFLHWPAAPEAATALLEYAMLLEARGRDKKAFDEYQYLIDRYAGRFPFETVIARQFAIAERMRTGRRRLLGGAFSSPEPAIPLFEQVVRNAPNWPQAPEAQFQAAAIRQEIGDLDLAIEAFIVILTRYPDSPPAEESLFRIAECLSSLSEKAPNDKGTARQARAYAARFLRDYPDSPRTPAAERLMRTIDERLAGYLYQEARFYDRVGRLQAARGLYDELLAFFPDSQWAAESRHRLAQLGAKGEIHP